MVPSSRPPNMPSWMSRIETQPKLFQITHTTGMLYSTAVHSTCGTMVKQPSPAIATHGLVGRGQLGAEHAGGAEAHAREAPRVEHRLRPARLPELHVPVVIDADVAGEDGIVRQHRLAIGDDALGPDRRGVDVEIRPGEVVPSRLPFLDVGVPCASARRPRLGERRSSSASSWRRKVRASARMADVGRIVAAELVCRRRRRGSACCAGSSRSSPEARTTPSGRRSARRWQSPRRRAGRPRWPDRRRCGR